VASAPAYREKSTFKWTTECQAASDYLKKCLMSAPTLTMPNWSQPFIIDMDASDTGIGAILSQVYDRTCGYVC